MPGIMFGSGAEKGGLDRVGGGAREWVVAKKIIFLVCVKCNPRM